jgi:hypothetical protein
MGEARVILTAQDNASRVIDQVNKRLGIFNKEGVAIGVTFALVNKVIELAMRGVQFLTDSFMKGITTAMDFEVNLVYLTNTIRNMDMSIQDVSENLHKMGQEFGVDVNSLAIAMKTFTREGYTMTESVKMLGQAEIVTKATGESIISVINAADTMFGVFNISAKNSGYVFEKLSEIYTLTGLSIEDIAGIISRASPEIRKAGYNLEDIVDIMYTISQTKAATRQYPSLFADYFKGIGGETITKMPEGTVKTAEEQANAVKETHKSATATIGIAWDNLWEDIGKGALDTADLIITEMKKDAVLNSLLFNKAPSSTMGDTGFQQSATDKAKLLLEQIQLQNQAIIDLTATTNTYEDVQHTKYTITYTERMRDATLAIQDQEDAIEKLNRVANRYSLEQQGNQLEIMRIQYTGSGRRRGLTRGEQKQIDIIERENMALRIKEAEQQLAIGNIQATGLQTAQDTLDALKRSHDAMMYNWELNDLSIHLDDMTKLWVKYYGDLATANQNYQNTIAGKNIFSVAPGWEKTWNKTHSTDVVSVVNQSIERGIMQKRGNMRNR